MTPARDEPTTVPTIDAARMIPMNSTSATRSVV
jgi:hypothetical protein